MFYGCRQGPGWAGLPLSPAYSSTQGLWGLSRGCLGTSLEQPPRGSRYRLPGPSCLHSVGCLGHRAPSWLTSWTGGPRTAATSRRHWSAVQGHHSGNRWCQVTASWPGPARRAPLFRGLPTRCRMGHTVLDMDLKHSLWTPHSRSSLPGELPFCSYKEKSNYDPSSSTGFRLDLASSSFSLIPQLRPRQHPKNPAPWSERTVPADPKLVASAVDGQCSTVQEAGAKTNRMVELASPEASLLQRPNHPGSPYYISLCVHILDMCVCVSPNFVTYQDESCIGLQPTNDPILT